MQLALHGCAPLFGCADVTSLMPPSPPTSQLLSVTGNTVARSWKSVSTGCVKLRPSSLETSSVLPAPTNTPLPLASTLPPHNDAPAGPLLSFHPFPTSDRRR